MKPKYTTWLMCNDDGDSIKLEQSPIGWDAVKFNLIRDLTYLGIMKSISVEYEFVGDGFRFMQSKRLKLGMDADIMIRVYQNNPNEWLFDGKINQENYVEDRKFRKYKVDIVQSSFVQNFQNREDIIINIFNNIGLDRQSVIPAARQDCLFRGKQIEFFSEFRDSSEIDPEIYHHILPFRLQVNGNPGVKEVGNISLAEDQDVVQDELYIKDNAFYSNDLPLDQTIRLKFTINYTIAYLGFTLPFLFFDSPSFKQTHTPKAVFRLVMIDAADEVVDTLFTKSYDSIFGNFTDTFDQSIVVPNGFSLVFACERHTMRRFYEDDVLFDTIDYGGMFLSEMDEVLRTEITYNSMSMTIDQDSIVNDSTHPVILPHELFSNIIAQLNGGTLYSDVFGRIDLGYYQDGEFAYLGITKGELLRGIDPTTVQVPTSMREAFKSYSSVICLGAIISEGQIRIDPLDALFNYNIAANIGEVEELTINPSKEFLFNSVKAGFPKNEYEQENGRDEINTEYQYTNAFKSVKKELDLMSKYYGDGYGIEFARRASVLSTGTADSRYDELIFFVDMIKVDGVLMTRRLEGILEVSGIFSPETALNLRIAVGQNMYRWRKYLNIPLHQKDKVYYFQSKDKNASLHLVTDLTITNDGQDLQTGNNAFFLPHQPKFKCAITIEKLFAILANPLGIIPYTYKKEQFFDFLMEVDHETDKGIGEWRMLGTKDSPVATLEVETGNLLMHDDGLDDIVAHEDADDDLVLYE